MQLKLAIKTVQCNMSSQRLANLLFAQENVTLSLQIFYWASRQKVYKHDNVMYTVLFQKLCSARNFEEVGIFMEDMRRNGWRNSNEMFSWAIETYIESPMVERDENIMNKMEERGCMLTISFYNYILKD